MVTNFNKSNTYSDKELYRALLAGDLPAAWLAEKKLSENEKEKDDPIFAFNCGLCLFLLEEWEAALGELKRAEHLFGNPPEFDVSEKKLFLKAIEQGGGQTAFLPLDPDSAVSRLRYGLLRTRWLTALCLVKLGRKQEAASVIRFLAQYNIVVTD